ncbi:MAG: hypothetical protein EOM12_13855 [Verrucomicrobiae bacterium]|nr:hypothetical protein [Verrucomicrobiae bacterium]
MVQAIAWQGEISRSFTCTGKAAKTLLALVTAGPHGITALELSNTWALRLSAYIYNLRHDYGLIIPVEREAHPGGWHGRYVLLTPVQVTKVDGNE